jgi:hypothetical protein
MLIREIADSIQLMLEPAMKLVLDPALRSIIVPLVIGVGYGLVGLFALGLLIFATGWIYEKLLSSGTQARFAIVIFVIVPAFVVTVTVIIAVFTDYAPLVLRCLFLALAIMIPPGLYYLFIATRRDSLLNAYISNLSRLGLLRHQRGLQYTDGTAGAVVEAENDRARRVRGFVERFEAIYGKLPDDYIPKLIDATSESSSNEFPKAPGASSHVDLKTMLPVVSAMILSAVGWAIVLPPSQASFRNIVLNQPATVAAVPSSETAKPTGAIASPNGVAGNDVGTPATPIKTATSWSSALGPDVSPVAFAFIGSYFFSIQMLMRRFVRRDLGPNAYNAISARMILSIIGVWVLQEGLAIFGLTPHSDYLYIFAFAIGVFPHIIWQLITASVKRFKYLSIAIPNLTAPMPLSSLEGLSVWHEARLEEEDIENIPNLALADVVELMLTTKFPPHRIIDWVDQALLRMVLGGAEGEANPTAPYATLRSYGVRTATTLVAFCVKQGNDGRLILDLLPDMDRSRIRALAAALSTAPNLPLLQTWLGLQTNSLSDVFPSAAKIIPVTISDTAPTSVPATASNSNALTKDLEPAARSN